MKKSGRQKPKKQTQVQTQVRVSEETRKRIRSYQEQVRNQTGLEINFATAVRTLIEKGLADVG